jgi:hypothetical protein
MATTVLGDELIEPAGRLIGVLDDYDPITQQKLLELLTVRHALHCSHKYSDRKFVAESFHKHVMQTLPKTSGPMTDEVFDKILGDIDGMHRAASLRAAGR